MLPWTFILSSTQISTCDFSIKRSIACLGIILLTLRDLKTKSRIFLRRYKHCKFDQFVHISMAVRRMRVWNNHVIRKRQNVGWYYITSSSSCKAYPVDVHPLGSEWMNRILNFCCSQYILSLTYQFILSLLFPCIA